MIIPSRLIERKIIMPCASDLDVVVGDVGGACEMHCAYERGAEVADGDGHHGVINYRLSASGDRAGISSGGDEVIRRCAPYVDDCS